MTGQFKPIRESHAIVEVVFFFEFTGRVTFGDEIEDRVRAALQGVAERSWSYEPVKSIEVNVVGSSTPGVRQTDDGFQAANFGANGELAWQVRAHRNQLSLHCLDYSRWAVTFGAVQEYLGALFSALGYQTATVKQFGMKVLDRFSYFGSLEEFSADKLFNKESDHLNKMMFNSKYRWHVHTGWFEQGGNSDEELLSQLNIDTSLIAPPDHRPNVGVSIDHTMSVLAVPSCDLGKEYNIWSDGLEKVFQRFEFMHTRNKEVLCSILHPDVAASMNMHTG